MAAELVSQVKIFADFGATSGGSGGGSRLLTKVKKMDVKDDRSVEIVNAVGISQGAGFRRKEGGGEITLNVYREVGPTREVDWRKVKSDQKVFTLTTQDEFSGMRESFTCMVDKVDASSDENGVHEDTVVLKYTKRY